MQTSAPTVSNEEQNDRPLPEVPCELGDFEVAELVGEGGTCCVYRATRLSDGEQVALKLLKPSYLAEGSEQLHIDEYGCGILECDYRVGVRFDHPHILRIGNFEPGGDCPHLEMEFFSPVSFHDYIQVDAEGNQRYRELAPNFPHYARQMCAALETMHDNGLVHGDVKPGNFLVDEQHHVKLIDFSYAKDCYVDGKFKQPTHTSGTEGYMSPEQQRRWPMDQRSDIYSLGRAWYVMLVGQFPFVERRKMSMKQLAESPVTPDAHRVNPQVTQEFADLLIEMLQDVPVNRPASVAEVVARLEEMTLIAEADGN